MRYGGKYSLKKILLSEAERVTKAALGESDVITVGKVFELGKDAEAINNRNMRSYIELDAIQKDQDGSLKMHSLEGAGEVAYYDKKAIEQFNAGDAVDARLVFQVAVPSGNISTEQRLAGLEISDKTGNVLSGKPYPPITWVAGNFKTMLTAGEDTMLVDIDETDNLPSGIVLIPKSNLKKLEAAADASLLPADQAASIEADYNALTDAQKSEIESLLQPVGQKVAWAVALQRIYGDDAANYPIVTSEIASRYDYTEGDSGRGEFLAADIFPNLAVIGAAGAEAGVDLFDVINKRKIEVKQTGMFRIGTKSRLGASKVIDLIKIALTELESAITAKKESVLSVSKEELLENIPDDVNSQEFKDFVGNYSGCTGCDNNSYAAMVKALKLLKSKPDTDFTFIQRFISNIYENILKDLVYDKQKAFSGELGLERANRTLNYFNVVKIDTSSLKSPLFSGATDRNGTINPDVMADNIKKEYIEGLNPEIAFAGTDIMVVSEDSYVIYTGARLGEKLKSAAENTSGTITQGMVQLTVDITKEMERSFAKDLDVTIATEDGVDAPGTQQNSSRQYRKDLQRLFEWAVK